MVGFFGITGGDVTRHAFIETEFGEETKRSRQSLFVGLWVAFCLWLQMNRTFGPAVAILAAAVLVLFELVLQIRERATLVQQQSSPS